ncbi:MAG: phosphoribosylformylglycinamidine synthase subunit PurS [Candidatus Micrarchaeia archaeon]
MAIYTVDVTIESKPAALDPEGSTIANDLMRKNGYAMVKGVRTAKLLKITLDAKDEGEAKKIAERMCNELRLVNPVAHVYSVSVRK